MLFFLSPTTREQVLRTARGVRGDDTAVPKLPLPVLAVAGTPVHRRPGPGLPGEARRRRPGLLARPHTAPDLPQVLLAVNARHEATTPDARLFALQTRIVVLNEDIVKCI